MREEILKKIIKNLKDEIEFYEHQVGLKKPEKIRELNYSLWVATGSKEGKYDKEIEDNCRRK